MNKLINDWAEFGKRHPIFYVPQFLLALIGLGVTVEEFSKLTNEVWLKLSLLILALLMFLAALVLSAAAFWAIAKSMLEEKEDSDGY